MSVYVHPRGSTLSASRAALLARDCLSVLTLSFSRRWRKASVSLASLPVDLSLDAGWEDESSLVQLREVAATSALCCSVGSGLGNWVGGGRSVHLGYACGHPSILGSRARCDVARVSTGDQERWYVRDGDSLVTSTRSKRFGQVCTPTPRYEWVKRWRDGARL